MSTINLKCENSIAFTNNANYNKEQNNIWMGVLGRNVYWSYLYFSFTAIPNYVDIISATLVIFKIAPTKENTQVNKNEMYTYSVVPALEYVSPYSYMYKMVQFNCDFLVDFIITENSAYVEIDLTEMVKGWINEEIENKGMLLQPNRHSKLLQFVGASSKNKGARPFLKVKYKEKLGEISNVETHEPMVRLPISIKIKGH